MKKRLFSALFAIILTAAAVSMAGCAEDVYGDLADEGYTLKVVYDAGGADIGNKEMTIVEVYNPSQAVTVDGKTGIYLLALNDERRNVDVRYDLEKFDDAGNKYYLAGWYRERTPRVNEQGEALDCFGVPVSQSGREQGYVYSGYWDFEKDLLETDVSEITLYAAWTPRFTYEFYAMDDSGEYALIGSVSNKLALNYPVEDTKNGGYKMKDYPSIEGKLFEGAYFDEAMTDAVGGNINGQDMFIDYEKGITVTNTVKIFVQYSDAYSE